MITFITGVPGSGKTLYAIDKLIRVLVGTTSKGEKDGVPIEYPRTIYTNINGLLLEHELIDGNGNWTLVDRTNWVFDGRSGGLRDWHLWAKPGSVIIMEEVQKTWKPRPNGSPVPPDIEALETHRHMGVDFIFMTQHALLVDRNLLAFVARHLHVRRVGNMNLAVVYEWDHCSKSLLYKNSITKSPYRYDKSVFKLYKSAELHTKQPRKIPGLVWFILIGMLGFAVAAPATVTRLQGRISGSKPISTAGAAAQSFKASTVVTNGPPSELLATTSPQVSSFVQSAPARPVYKGCIASVARCQCFDAAGLSVRLEPEVCRSALFELGQSIPIFDSLLQASPLLAPVFASSP